jgi:hypothetical protein
MTGAYIGGSVHDNKNRQGNYFSRVSVFANIEMHADIRFRLQAEARRYAHSILNDESLLSIEGRYRITENTDFRLKYQKHEVKELILSAGFYW